MTMEEFKKFLTEQQQVHIMYVVSYTVKLFVYKSHIKFPVYVQFLE